MLKKILTILCLAATTSSSICMEEDYSFKIYLPQNHEDSDEISDNDDSDNYDEDFRQKLKNKINKRKEQKIIKFLVEQHIFVASNLLYTLNLISKANLIKAMEHLQETFLMTDEEQEICDNALRNIQPAQQPTDFKTSTAQGQVHDEIYRDPVLPQPSSQTESTDTARTELPIFNQTESITVPENTLDTEETSPTDSHNSHLKKKKFNKLLLKLGIFGGTIGIICLVYKALNTRPSFKTGKQK